mgnify:CR=1 FL=1
MKKALQTIGLTLMIAALAVLGVGLLTFGAGTHADTDPNTILTRRLMPYLKDGQTFTLAQAYPSEWDSVQIVHNVQDLTDWEWRTLGAYDAALVDAEVEQQVLVFWHDGVLTNAVRLQRKEQGVPWFELPADELQSYIVHRKDAVGGKAQRHALERRVGGRGGGSGHLKRAWREDAKL